MEFVVKRYHFHYSMDERKKKVKKTKRKGRGEMPAARMGIYSLPFSKRLIALRMPLTEAKLMLCSVPTP